jgi:hypothetical protein
MVGGMGRIVILTTGDYSDYSIEDLVEIPDDLDLAAEMKRWNRYWTTTHPIEMARSDAESDPRADWRKHVLSLPGVRNVAHEEFHWP